MGSHRCSLMVTQAGPSSWIGLLLRGEHIRGSPFSVPVEAGAPHGPNCSLYIDNSVVLNDETWIEIKLADQFLNLCDAGRYHSKVRLSIEETATGFMVPLDTQVGLTLCCADLQSMLHPPSLHTGVLSCPHTPNGTTNRYLRRIRSLHHTLPQSQGVRGSMQRTTVCLSPMGHSHLSSPTLRHRHRGPMARASTLL